MAKKIGIIGATQSSLWTSVSAVFWFPIASGIKTQTAGSAWAGASAAENTAIQNGTVLEEQQSFNFPSGLATASMKDYLDNYWTRRNAQIAGVGPGLYAGVFEDSITGWSA
jgi:hypothetical protein